MGLLTQRKEHRIPDLSRYDYYYQGRDDFNKSQHLSAAAAYAASRSRGNPVLAQQRSQSFTQPRRVIRTRPRAISRGAVEGRNTQELPRTNSIVRIARSQDGKSRTKSITRKTIRRIDGVDYIETVTTTPLEDEDNARHFNEFSEPVDDYTEEYPQPRRVRRVRKTISSPRSVKSPRSPPRSPAAYEQADGYQYGEAALEEAEDVPPAPATTSMPAPVRRSTSTPITRPVRSKTTKSVYKPVTTGVAPPESGRRLTEQEMYAKALEIAQRNVYSGSDFTPEVIDSAGSRGHGVSRMGQRSLRRGSRSKKVFNLFNKDRDADAGVVGGTGAGAETHLPAAEAPRASGASSLDNRLGQNVETSASSVSGRNLSDEEMYSRALAMSQMKAQRHSGEPETGTRPLNLGGAEREVRSPQTIPPDSFATPSETIDENQERVVEDAGSYGGEWKDAHSEFATYDNNDIPVKNTDRYNFEEPEPEEEPEQELVSDTEARYRGVAADEAPLETEQVESGLEQEYVDPDRIPHQSAQYENEVGSGLASPIDTTKSGFTHHIAAPEEVRAGDLQRSGVKAAETTAGRSPAQQGVYSPLQDATARGGFDSEADVNAIGGAAARGAGADVATGVARKQKGLSRFKTRKSLFGSKPEEQPLPDLPQNNLAQAEHGELGGRYPSAQGVESTAKESRPKNKIKSMFNKVVEFGAENSGYQPPRNVKEQQKAEKLGAGALKEGESSVSQKFEQRGANADLVEGDAAYPYRYARQGEINGAGTGAEGAALGGGGAAAGTTADTATPAATGGVGRKSGGGTHPWRRHAQPVTTTSADGGVASGRTPADAEQPIEQPRGPALWEGKTSSEYGREQPAEDDYAHGFADGVRDSQYQSGAERAEKANGFGAGNSFGADAGRGDLGGSGTGRGATGTAAATDLDGEGLADETEAGLADRYGLKEKVNQAKDSEMGQEAIGKAKDTAQSQVKEQKGNLFKKLFKK